MARLSLSAALVAAALSVSCNTSPLGDIGGGGTMKGAEDPRPRYEDYARGDRFPRLVIEVDSVAGVEPREEVEQEIAGTLSGLVEKPGGVSVQRDGEIASRGADHGWTFEELQALAEEQFALEVPADTIKMHVMFVDGRWHEDSGDSRVLGIAWAHTHAVIFKQTIEDACRIGPGGPLSERLCANAEHGVWLHELGHVMGLVNVGAPMVTGHEDPDHRGHSHNRDCVMFWAYETGGLLDLLRDRLIEGDDSRMGFDAACRADLEALRSGGATK